jgi:hypothetical protein
MSTTIVCPVCGGAMWDERKSKYYGTGIADSGRPKPIFKCKNKLCDGVIWPDDDELDQRRPEERKSKAKIAGFTVPYTLAPTPQGPTYKEVKATMEKSDVDPVQVTRQHLMKAANLYNLCVKAVVMAIEPNVPEALKTPEWLQAAVASLWIEASSRRSDDNVTWWSYIDKMPGKPLDNNEVV